MELQDKIKRLQEIAEIIQNLQAEREQILDTDGKLPTMNILQLA